MKRLGFSVSMNSSYGTSADKEIQSIFDDLDEEDYGEETVQIAEKKRRLSVEQVKSLEKIFEVENKLKPERKMKLAQDFGLQPRQVAVWFQNRRARWKTKQLERDYEILKSDYEALRTNYDALISDKESLLLELKELKSKFKEDNGDIKVTVKDVIVPTESANRLYQQTKLTNPIEEKIGQIDQNFNRPSGSLMFVNLKDGSSDSDSSTIFNEDNTSAETLAVILSDQPSTQQNYFSSPTTHGLERWESWTSEDTSNVFYSSVKIEEHNLLNTEASYNFFSDQEAPRLSWFYPEEWNFEEEGFL